MSFKILELQHKIWMLYLWKWIFLKQINRRKSARISPGNRRDDTTHPNFHSSVLLAAPPAQRRFAALGVKLSKV